MIKKSGLTPSRILYLIKKQPNAKNKTYVITGQLGPTGKTWLYNKLKAEGYNVVEISEPMYYLVHYMFDQNHYIDDGSGSVVIVLNKLIKLEEVK